MLIASIVFCCTGCLMSDNADSLISNIKYLSRETVIRALGDDRYIEHFTVFTSCQMLPLTMP